MTAPVPFFGTSCSTFRNTRSTLHTCAVPSKHDIERQIAGGAFDTNSRQQNTEQEVKDMNRNSLLAVALIAMVCTGLGVASVSDSQLPLDVPSNMDGIYGMMLSVVDEDGVTTVAMTDGEDEHSFVFDPNEPLPDAFDPITDEDGNVIGASYNVTDEDGNVIAGVRYGFCGDAPEDFGPETRMRTSVCRNGEDGNVVAIPEEDNGGF